MADDKQNKGEQDNIRVDKNDPSEVEYLHSRYPNKTHEEIKQAIEKYGLMRQHIEEALARGNNYHLRIDTIP